LQELKTALKREREGNRRLILQQQQLKVLIGKLNAVASGLVGSDSTETMEKENILSMKPEGKEALIEHQNVQEDEDLSLQ
jgi:hypothetical protein